MTCVRFAYELLKPSMAKRKITRQRKATFPRLREIREKLLGWDVADIMRRLPDNRPSMASIYRLEQGGAVRITNARRVFDVVNAGLNNSLDVSKELKAE
jgi:hypothetical protein